MEHNISILFYSKSSKRAKNNQVPIYLRITINGTRIEQSTHRFVHGLQWSSAAGRMKGNSLDAKSLNGFLDALRSKVHAIERAMTLDGIEITYESFKQRWFGVKQDAPTLLQVFKQHNEELKLLAGKDFAPLTVKRYSTALKHTREFIKWKYKASDFEISKLNYEFISSFCYGKNIQKTYRGHVSS